MMSERKPVELPACFATVHPGLESIAGDEITRDLGAEDLSPVPVHGPVATGNHVFGIDRATIEVRDLDRLR